MMIVTGHIISSILTWTKSVVYGRQLITTVLVCGVLDLDFNSIFILLSQQFWCCPNWVISLLQMLNYGCDGRVVLLYSPTLMPSSLPVTRISNWSQAIWNYVTFVVQIGGAFGMDWDLIVLVGLWYVEIPGFLTLKLIVQILLLHLSHIWMYRTRIVLEIFCT